MSLLNRFSAALARWVFILSITILIMHPSHTCENTRPYSSTPKDPAAPQVIVRKPVPDKPSAGPKRTVLSYGRFRKVELSSHPIIIEAASRHRVDPALIKAIIMAESGYNPNAVSSKGAKGLMQLMPLTAEWLGVQDVFNPEHNINGGVEYFKMLLNQFSNDVKLALAAYNAGSRKVRQYKGIPPFKATKVYIRKVIEYYDFYKEQMPADADAA